MCGASLASHACVKGGRDSNDDYTCSLDDQTTIKTCLVPSTLLQEKTPRQTSFFPGRELELLFFEAEKEPSLIEPLACSFLHWYRRRGRELREGTLFLVQSAPSLMTKNRERKGDRRRHTSSEDARARGKCAHRQRRPARVAQRLLTMATRLRYVTTHHALPPPPRQKKIKKIK